MPEDVSAISNHPGRRCLVLSINTAGFVDIRNIDRPQIIECLGNIARDAMVSLVAIGHYISQSILNAD